MRLSLLLSFVLFPLFSQAVECVGVHESVGKDNKAFFDSVKLEAEFETPKTLKLTGDLNDIRFVVLTDKETDSYLLMITLGPDYTRGVTAGLTWDQDNSMRISRVDQDTVYRLVCKK